MLWAFSRIRSAGCLFIMVACFAAISAGGARAESPAVYMQRVQNELIVAQKSGGVAQFANVLRQHMDVPGIGLTALGPHARTLPKDERPAYYLSLIHI